MVSWSGRRNQRCGIITVNDTPDRHQDPRSLRVILVLIGIEYSDLWALGPISPANQQAKPHWLEPNPNDAYAFAALNRFLALRVCQSVSSLARVWMKQGSKAQAG